MKLNSLFIFLFFMIVLVSCDKGYELRFTNYYLEPMDSVIIGSNTIVYKNVEVKMTTPANKIKKGNYGVTCVSKSKKRFFGELQIPSKGSGVRTLQIDGLGSIVTLEE